jgi:hypothetical protein
MASTSVKVSSNRLQRGLVPKLILLKGGEGKHKDKEEVEIEE